MFSRSITNTLEPSPEDFPNPPGSTATYWSLSKPPALSKGILKILGVDHVSPNVL